MHRLYPKLQNKKLVIFDYNGTILYDLDICLEALNSIFESQNIPALSLEEYKSKFYFPVKSFYQDMGFDFSKVSYEDLSIQFMENYNENLHRCGVYNGIIELLHELKKNNIQTAILTALHQKELFKQLPIFGLEGLFDATFGLEDVYAHSKIERGHELMKHMKVAPQDTILIGDTTHDAEVAHALGIDVILLDEGHQTTERLDHKRVSSQVTTDTYVVSLQRSPQIKIKEKI
jgi:phosphoglycolate phosphatase